MPVRRRLQAIGEKEIPPWMFMAGDGSQRAGGAEARRAWSRVRRVVWAGCRRFDIPGAAEAFDGLTADAFRGLNDPRPFLGSTGDGRPVVSRRGASELFRAEVAEWFAADRANVAAFARTAAGHSIGDFLAMMLADLDALEQAWRAGMCRPLSNGWYGDGVRRAG
jgi:hypothetical protein